MDDFTGAQWGRSERPVLTIIPREGQVDLVMPKFEEPSIRQSFSLPAEVRPWEEDESPYSFTAFAHPCPCPQKLPLLLSRMFWSRRGRAARKSRPVSTSSWLIGTMNWSEGVFL